MFIMIDRVTYYVYSELQKVVIDDSFQEIYLLYFRVMDYPSVLSTRYISISKESPFFYYNFTPTVF